MYEPYPGTGPQPQPPAPPASPPPSIQKAVRLMYAGAAIEVVAFVIALLTSGSRRASIVKAHPGYTVTQVHRTELALTVPLAIGAVIAIILWVWRLRRQRGWSRQYRVASWTLRDSSGPSIGWRQKFRKSSPSNCAGSIPAWG